MNQRKSSRKRRRVVVRVSATTANLGPGFDALGMALELHNQVEVKESDSFGIVVSGEGAGVISRSKDNKVYEGMVAVYQRIGRPIPPLFLSCHNNIPLARGLGSSAAAVVSGLVAANYLCGSPLSSEDLLEMGAQLEGHPDNVAPALFGGCQIVVQEEGRLVHISIPLPPELRAVVFIPDFEISTVASRAVLSSRVSRKDAVYNLGRAALLTAALASGQLQYLKVATKDRLHQPMRQALFPAMGNLFAAALTAGALGVFLSGSGPTILALTTAEGYGIGEAMQAMAQKAGVSGIIRTICPCFSGAQLAEED